MANPPLGSERTTHGGFEMKVKPRPILRAAGVATVMLLGVSGCAAGNPSASTPMLPKRVGDFTLEWVKGNGLLQRTPRSISTGDATFTIGPGPSYPITAKMPDGRLSAADLPACPPPLMWQVDLTGPNPGMLCPKAGALVLELFYPNGPGVPLGAAEGDIMAGDLPVALGPHSLGGYVVESAVAWWLRGKGGTILASGVWSTLTSGTAALPSQLLPSGGGTRLLSLGDQLYILRATAIGYEVSRFVPWDPEPRLDLLGAVPGGRLWAIDQNGGVWMTRRAGAGRIDLIRAVPGQANVHTWHAKGQLVGAGPGFLAYLAPAGGQKILHLMFPLSHRTLILRGLRPPFASMQQAEDGSAYLHLHLATGRRVARIAWSPLN